MAELKLILDKKKKRRGISIGNVQSTAKPAQVAATVQTEMFDSSFVLQNVNGAKEEKDLVKGSCRLDNINDSSIQIKGSIDSCFIKNCSKSTFFIGFVSGSIMIENCLDCMFYLGCRQVYWKINLDENSRLQ